MSTQPTTKPTLIKAVSQAFIVSLTLAREAYAFSAPFVTKVNDISTQLILIGKALVGIAAVLAIIMALTNKGPNWRWIGTIFIVGVALVSFDIVKTYILH